MHIYHDSDIAKMAKVAADLNATMALTYLTVAVATAMIACMTTTGLYLSIHTASPGNTGASEIVGSTMSGYASGGYTGARKSIGWAAYGSAAQVSNTTQTFALLAIQASGIPYFGLWTADGTAGATFITGGPTTGLSGSIPSAANVTFTSAVTLSVAG